MEKSSRKLLQKSVTYTGEGISVRALEETISRERNLQDRRLSDLNDLRTRNTELQSALSEEMKRLREISKSLAEAREEKGLLTNLFKWLPWVKDPAAERRSIEDLLRRQYEISSVRLKEAAEFADRLEAAKIDLFDEIDRLNEKIVNSAENEEKAGLYVLELRELRTELEAKIELNRDTAEERKLQMELDKTRRLLAEHTTKLKLYATAEERLDKLKRNTRQLAETIAHLQSDITRYVTAASEKMDLISGQIQAIGAAADASVVMLELKQSLDAMTESINETTRFVAETQSYFRENVDTMIEDLDLYDAETEEALRENNLHNQVLDDLDLDNALSGALAKKIDQLAEEMEQNKVVLDTDGGESAPAEQPETEEATAEG
jgi:hypothetical protein